MALSIFLGVLALLVIVTLAKTIKIVPQAHNGVVERFGKYQRTLSPGLNVITPFIDRVRYMVDLREQVVSFPPQPVITEDNLVVSIDTVIYFQVIDPTAATYRIADYIQAIEQLTMTTLRNIIGGMTLEHTLTSRDQINTALRGVLDGATGQWGIRVNRVELKGVDPPPSIKDAMEKQMRADRDKRAAILTAEGERQSAILTAEGEKQSMILSAEGDRESAILRAQAEREAQILKAQGEGQAIQTVFQAIHDGRPDQSLLAYQYLQMIPKIADGEANKMWIVPSEIGKAMEGLGAAVGAIPTETSGPRERVDLDAPVREQVDDTDGHDTSETRDAVSQALAAAKAAAAPASARSEKKVGEQATEEAEAAEAAHGTGAPPSGEEETAEQIPGPRAQETAAEEETAEQIPGPRAQETAAEEETAEQADEQATTGDEGRPPTA